MKAEGWRVSEAERSICQLEESPAESQLKQCGGTEKGVCYISTAIFTIYLLSVIISYTDDAVYCKHCKINNSLRKILETRTQ